MADKKTTALSENTAPSLTDIFAMVNDPSGSALNQKMTYQTLLALAYLAGITSGYHSSQDLLMLIDNGTPKTTTLSNLFAGIEDFLSELTAAPALTDTLLVIDGGVAKYIQVQEFLPARYIQPRLVEAATELTVTQKVGDWHLHIPPELNGLSLVYAHVEVDVAGVTGTQTFQIRNETDTVDLLSTLLTIDTTETGSDEAAAPYVIKSDGSEIVNTNDLIVLDSDVIQTTAAQGLVLTLGFA